MELSPINASLIVTTWVELDDIHQDKRRETRVTHQSIKRMLRTELDSISPTASHALVCAVVTRVDDFLGIELIRPVGSAQELGILDLQVSLLSRLEALGALSGQVSPQLLRDLRRPMTTESHGGAVDQLGAVSLASPLLDQALAIGLDALQRSLAIPATAEQLGVQWSKSKMLDIRADANPLYAVAPG